MNKKLLLMAAVVFALVASLIGPATVAASPPEMVKVLIGFDRQPGSDEEAIVRGAGGSIRHAYHLVPAIAASIPEAAIQGLLRNPKITRIEPDITVYAIDTELDNSWGVKHIGAGAVHDGGNMGTSVKIAIIDSGIDYNHPDLNDNYAGGYDFYNNDPDPMDIDGHGTHVAGIIAGEDNGFGVVGVAPEAEIYALKVLEGGTGDYSDVIAAVQWAVDNGIQVTNNSYGSSLDPGETVMAAFDEAYAAGLIHIAAAGNGGNPPGRGDNVIFPARWDSVVAVAATDGSNERARWSSTGPDVELSAPGVNINSTLPGGGYGGMSGTSMASPHVAGTAALVIAAGITGNDVIRQQLIATADDLGDTGLDPKYGYGLVDADEAAGAVVPPPPPPSEATAYLSIEMSLGTKKAGPNVFTNAIASVKVLDAEGGNPIAGATVSGEWSGDLTSGAASALTDANGVATINSAAVKNVSNGIFIFTVVSITKDGVNYLPQGEESDSISIP